MLAQPLPGAPEAPVTGYTLLVGIAVCDASGARRTTHEAIAAFLKKTLGPTRSSKQVGE